ncbi:MAG: polymorphic toxin type 47 domain-containing protein [Bryobacter sp.]|nr:polymorphic toxin type 47 domain-containing protein [Bryobacter sp.]
MKFRWILLVQLCGMVAVLANAAETRYLYDGGGNLLVETGPASATAGVSYLTQDALGSTRLVTDGAGAQKECLDYLPFGEEISQTLGNRPACYQDVVYPGATVAGRQEQRFTGKERDQETGLDYFGARYLSGAQGRFTSPDSPFIDQNPEFPQSWNLYSYTRNNPLKYVDRTGEAIETAWDVLNIGLGVKSFVDNVRSGNYGSAAIDAVGVVVDSAAAVVPFVPGGAGAVIKGARLAEKADDLVDGVKALNRVDDAADTAKVGKQGGKNFDEARREGFEKAGMTNPNDVKFSKVDPKTGTIVEFKGPGGAKVAYDGPHSTPGPGHNSPHVGYQSAGKRTQGGTQRGNIPYTGPQHPSRPVKKLEGDVEPH